jgi:hypothetical protein
LFQFHMQRGDGVVRAWRKENRPLSCCRRSWSAAKLVTSGKDAISR